MARLFGRISKSINKYHAQKISMDNISFASKAEAQRYLALKIRMQSGEILHLVLQPKYILQEGFEDKEGNKHRSVTYIPDFEYYDVKAQAKVIEDVKGFSTPEYKIKKKLFIKQYIEPYSDVVFREVLVS